MRCALLLAIAIAHLRVALGLATRRRRRMARAFAARTQRSKIGGVQRTVFFERKWARERASPGTRLRSYRCSSSLEILDLHITLQVMCRTSKDSAADIIVVFYGCPTSIIAPYVWLYISNQYNTMSCHFSLDGFLLYCIVL